MQKITLFKSKSITNPYCRFDPIKPKKPTNIKYEHLTNYSKEHLIGCKLTFKNKISFTGLTEDLSQSAYSRDKINLIRQNYKDQNIGNLPTDWIKKIDTVDSIKDIYRAFSDAAIVLDNTMDIHYKSQKSNPGDYIKASQIISDKLKKHKIIKEDTNIKFNFIGNGFFGAVFSFEVLGKKYIFKKYYKSKDPAQRANYEGARNHCEINKGHGNLIEINRAALIKNYAEPNNNFVEFFFANLENKFMIAKFADANSSIPKNKIDVSYLNLVATDDKQENFVEITDPKTGEKYHITIDYGGYKMILSSLTDNKETIRVKKSICETVEHNRINKWNEIYEKNKNLKNNESTMLGLLAAITLLPKPDNETCITKFYNNRDTNNLNPNEKNLFAELIKDFPKENRLVIFKKLYTNSNNQMKQLLANNFIYLNQEEAWIAFKMLMKDPDYLTMENLAQNINHLKPDYCYKGFKMLLENPDEKIKGYLAFNFNSLDKKNKAEIFELLEKDASKSFKEGPLAYIKATVDE